MNDRKFELLKILIEKLLLAIVLAITTYSVNVTIQRYESNKEIQAEYRKRKATIAFEIAEHAASSIGLQFALNSSLEEMLNSPPDCNSLAGLQYVQIVNDIIQHFAGKIQRKNEKILELTFKADLYLNHKVSSIYLDFLHSLHNKNLSEVLASILSNIETITSTSPVNCEKLYGELKKIMDISTPNKAKPLFLELIRELGKIIPDINKNGIYMITNDEK